jgi:hypothetical protein
VERILIFQRRQDDDNVRTFAIFERSLRTFPLFQRSHSSNVLMARTKQTAVRKPAAAKGKGKGKKEDSMPPLRSSPRRKTSPRRTSPRRKTQTTPPRRKAGAPVRSSPRVSKAAAAKAPAARKHKLPTKRALAHAAAQAAVLEKQHRKNFPGLATPPSNSSKGVHFTVFDDECLCQAYCHVSIDSVKGANQPHGDFWTAVAARANTLLAEGGRPHRSVDSIDTRWTKKISKAVLAFKAYHKDALSSPQSGWDASMYTECAQELYKADEGREYQFMHCSLILKAIPKYDWEAESVGSDVENTTAIGGPMGGSMDRPVGNRAAKAAAKAARAKTSRTKKQKTPDTLSVEGSAAMEQLVANSSAMAEHINNLALRNSLYLEFQMLMRMGRVDEANAIYDRMSQLTKPDFMVNGVAERNSVPSRVAARLQLESSEEDSSLEQRKPIAKPKNDADYATDGSMSGSSSGGDAAAANRRDSIARAAAIKAAIENRDLEPV